MGLITLALAKDELDIPSAETAENTRVQSLVDAATAYIEAQCNRVFASATYTHQFDGNDTRYLLLDQFPVTSITSINIDDTWTFAGGTALPASGDYAVHRGVLAARRCALFQYTSALAIKVVYVAGYSTIPEDIQQATRDLVRWLYFSRNDRRSGLAAKSKLGENVAFTEGLPPSVAAMIECHKRDKFIADRLAIFNPDMIAKIKGKPVG